MKKLTRLSVLASLAAALLTSGCATFTKGPNQLVEVTSVPEGARIRADGNIVGITPMRVPLSRKTAHTIAVEKPHFKTVNVTLLTVPNEAVDAYVRFGVDELSGALNNLTPSSVHAELEPEVLPEQPGDNPFSELAAKIVEVDEKLADGTLTAADHRYIVARLIEFYNPDNDAQGNP